jgi:hypothetical protein
LGVHHYLPLDRDIVISSLVPNEHERTSEKSFAAGEKISQSLTLVRNDSPPFRTSKNGKIFERGCSNIGKKWEGEYATETA